METYKRVCRSPSVLCCKQGRGHNSVRLPWLVMRHAGVLNYGPYLHPNYFVKPIIESLLLLSITFILYSRCMSVVNDGRKKDYGVGMEN